MKKEMIEFKIDTIKRPNVLLLGNGMLKLGNDGISWEKLLDRIKMRQDDVDVKNVPYAMQPEVYCGVDVEEIQRRVSNTITTLADVHPLLIELLSLPFDAILTTNYTYEIESILYKKEWTPKSRRDAYVSLDGNNKVKNNTFVCNAVKTSDRGIIPVFHLHGEKERKHSLVLSYYSYANSLSRLTKYNKELGNSLYECQQEEKMHVCKCWLDFFLLGNVWSVGFGLDISEFDIWWAIERKARECAEHGIFKAYFDRDEKDDDPQKVLLDAMKMDYRYIPVKNKSYETMYEEVIDDIRRDLPVISE